MKILHLLPGLKVGGQETMIVNIANEQAKTEEVVVMIINDDYDKHLLSLFDEKVDIVLLGRPRSSRNPLWLLKLNYNILKRHPDVVHSHYEKLTMYLFKYGYKFIYTIHGFTIPPKYIRKNKNLVAISKGIQEDVKRRAGVDSTVIYNGIKVKDIKQCDYQKEYSEDRIYRILQVSRLYHEIKGQDILIKAVALLWKMGYNNIAVDFIGEGPSLEYLGLIVKEMELPNVSFLGTKPVEYIEEHLCEYDLFVQPSRHEGFGLTVAEAMAARIPVVVADCPGLLEVVDNGVYGLVFQKENVSDCANKILQIIKTEKTILENKVDLAYKYVYNTFDVKATAQNYLNFYKECE